VVSRREELSNVFVVFSPSFPRRGCGGWVRERDERGKKEINGEKLEVKTWRAWIMRVKVVAVLE
jgi:hypothetical protein